MKIHTGRNAICGNERTNNSANQKVRTAPLWIVLFVYYKTGDCLFHENAKSRGLGGEYRLFGETQVSTFSV